MASAYRDSVQISSNYSYQPSVIPTGIVEKIDWKQTWKFFRQTTLQKVVCNYRKIQLCDFNFPVNAPSKIVTNFYNLKLTEQQLQVPANSVASLASLQDGHLLVAQRNGNIFDYDPNSGLSLNVFNLRKSYLELDRKYIKGPLAGVNEALGLGIRDIHLEEKPNKIRLFYTYTQVDKAGCLSMNFESVELDRVRNSIKGWSNRKEIWNTKTECLRFKEAHILGSGGKIEKLSSNQFLITLGDLNLIDNRVSKSMWGNIFRVDLESRKAVIFTRGHRNPSGIIKLLDGRIFEVEQGPQGGDEINLLRPGLDYGWPQSSFGKNYSFGGYKAGENSHEFGRAPLMAFVPSPAFSSIATFSEVAPEYWTNSKGIPDLFISSLKANSIYRCRIDWSIEDINYCEKIFLRERLRDIVAQARNGSFKIFVLTDRGSIISIAVEDPIQL